MKNHIQDQLQEARFAEIPGLPGDVFQDLYSTFDEVCQLPMTELQELKYRPETDDQRGVGELGYSDIEPFTHTDPSSGHELRIAGRRAFDYAPELGRCWLKLSMPKVVKYFLHICDNVAAQGHAIMKRTLAELDNGSGRALLPAYPDGVTAPNSRFRIARYNSEQVNYGDIDDPLSPQLIVPHHDMGYSVLALDATHPGFYGGSRDPDRSVRALGHQAGRALFFVGRQWQACHGSTPIEPLYHGAIKTEGGPDGPRNIAILFTDLAN